jgi:hypothetical protein
MEIAYRLLPRLGGNIPAAEFIFGSVAPDSVHMNPEYEVRFKVQSHLFEGCGEWGNTGDYDRWERNIDSFWSRQKERRIRDEELAFAGGVFTHCYTDYYNDLNLWRRFQRQYIPPMTPAEFRTSYYREARGIDNWLYYHSHSAGEIMQLLEKGRFYPLEGLLREKEAMLEKQHLLQEQYEDRQDEIQDFRFLKEEILMEFIENTVDAIEKKFRENGGYLLIP